MPGRRKKVRLPNGKQAEGVVVPVQATTEQWNEYFLEDGTVLRVKIVVTEVVHIEGQYDPSGNPLYATQSATLMVVSSPEELMRPEEGGES